MLVSSGAIAAGLAPLGLKRRPRALAAQQAAASVGQGLLVHRYTEELARHGIVAGQVLLTVDDVTRRSHYRNAYQTFAKLLELGVLPIVNENDTVATTEIRFGDNDRLAALVAHLVHADLLVLLSDVDGLYDGNPADPGTALITEVAVRRRPRPRCGSARPARAGVGTGGMQTKVEAARIATGAGIPVVLTVGRRRPPTALAGDAGRHPLPRRPAGAGRPGCCGWPTRPSRKGTLVLDAGAVRAVDRAPRLAARRRASPACAGTFVAGDPVDLAGPDGAPVARGLVNFDADELPEPARPLLARAQARARRGVRARGRPPRRPGAALSHRVRRCAWAGSSSGSSSPRCCCRRLR